MDQKRPMTQTDRLRELGLFEARVPRYTSYPTAPVFGPDVGAAFQERCLGALDPRRPVSVYLHVPFCERLCWFCACHTQGTRTLTPVERYVAAVEDEIARIAGLVPEGVTMRHLHWGGGTPTILPAGLIGRIEAAIRGAFPLAPNFEFSVETDPTMIDAEKVGALRAAGMTRASIGIQDFAPEVQAAIGRPQSFEMTRDCVAMLRAAGLSSLNTDLVYGLPHQTPARLADTIRQVIALAPDRVALFGYAHVPHMSKRQKLIDAQALPDDEARFHLATLARDMFVEAGFVPVGIDHFGRPGDAMVEAALAGRLRRNFQGYTTDDCETLVGLGASSISRFRQGYVQNAPATAAYQERVGAGQLAGARGHVFMGEDLLRAAAIEQLLCSFRIDQARLVAEFGVAANTLRPIHEHVAQVFGAMVATGPDGIALSDTARPLVRLIARRYDAYDRPAAQYSKAS
jgi:oxygen-independent coproporphyrinogen-3 oxidase